MIAIFSYLRALFLIPFVVVWTGAWSFFVVFTLLLQTRRLTLWAIRELWSRGLLAASGVKLVIQGRERLPKTGFLYVFNHTSHYDIPALFVASPRFPFFGAKSELFKIPLFGRAMTMVGALPIERKNRDKVLQIYRDAKARVLKGDVFALAPEGTRQAGGGELGDFKLGPFIFAVHAQMPVVPVVIVGAEKIIPKHSVLINTGRWQRKIIVEFLDPIVAQGEGDAGAGHLRAQVRERMQQRLGEHWKAENLN